VSFSPGADTPPEVAPPSDETAVEAHGRGAVGYGELVRANPDFRRLWLGEVVSLLGDWFNLLASALLLASLTGASGPAVAGLFVVRMLAPFLAAPVGGVLADRLEKRKLLVASDLARAVIVLGFVFVRTPEDAWLLYVLTALQLGFSGIFFPARDAFLPELVQRDELGTANALTSASWSVMLALGAALGGLVTWGAGVYPAFVIDSATFVASAVLVAGIRVRPEPALRRTGRALRGALEDIAAGLDYLRVERDDLAVALHKAAVALTTSGPFTVIQVKLAEEVYGSRWSSAISLSLMYAVVGVGTGVGPIAARRFTGDREGPLRLAVFASYFVTAAGLLVIAGTPGLLLLLAGFFLRGVGGGTIWVFSSQILLQRLPGEVRGRVFGTEFALFTLANAAGAWLAGLATADGLRHGTVVMLAVTTAAFGLLWGSWIGRRPVRERT
jgi:predicted MFS family arabinose efflux permease